MFSVRRAVFCSAGVFATLALSTGIASAGPILNYQIDNGRLLQLHHGRRLHGHRVYSGYTFDGVTMSNGATDASGNATVFLGTLARDNDNYSQSPTGSDFVLQFAFLLPLSIGDGTDELVATIVGSQGEPGDLDFDNTFKTYTFTSASGTGSFEFRVNDILALNKNHSGGLTATCGAWFSPPRRAPIRGGPRARQLVALRLRPDRRRATFPPARIEVIGARPGSTRGGSLTGFAFRIQGSTRDRSQAIGQQVAAANHLRKRHIEACVLLASGHHSPSSRVSQPAQNGCWRLVETNNFG